MTDLDFGPGDYESEWIDNTPSLAELEREEGKGLCPRCGGPLSVEIPDPDVGYLGGIYCENVLDTDDTYYCMWPDDSPQPIRAS